MIDCPIIRKELKLSQKEYDSLYPIAMASHYGYWHWEHACNIVNAKPKCNVLTETMNDKEYDNHIISHFEDWIVSINNDPVHHGDCTKESCPCSICHMKRYFEDARLISKRCS